MTNFKIANFELSCLKAVFFKSLLQHNPAKLCGCFLPYNALQMATMQQNTVPWRLGLYCIDHGLPIPNSLPISGVFRGSR